MVDLLELPDVGDIYVPHVIQLEMNEPWTASFGDFSLVILLSYRLLSIVFFFSFLRTECSTSQTINAFQKIKRPGPNTSNVVRVSSHKQPERKASGQAKQIPSKSVTAAPLMLLREQIRIVRMQPESHRSFSIGFTSRTRCWTHRCRLA